MARRGDGIYQRSTTWWLGVPVGGGRPLMAIMFHKDSTLGLGSFIQVLANGQPVGRIFHRDGVHQFHSDDEPTLGGAALQDEDLDRLKDKIVSKYRQA